MGLVPPVHPNCRCVLVPVNEDSARAMLGREGLMAPHDIAFLGNAAFNKVRFDDRIKAWLTLEKNKGTITADDLVESGILPKSGYDPQIGEDAVLLLETAYRLREDYGTSIEELDAYDRMAKTAEAIALLGGAVGKWVDERMTMILIFV